MNEIDFKQTWRSIPKSEYRKFKNIPLEERMSDDSTLCGLLYIDNLRRSKTTSILQGCDDSYAVYIADHTDFNKFETEDALYLTRCGFSYDGGSEVVIFYYKEK